MDLHQLGWSSLFEEHFREHEERGLEAARIARQERHAYLLYSEHGELRGELAGRLRHMSVSRSDLPVVGDWVAVQVVKGTEHGIIHAVLPRRSRFSRKVADQDTEEQVVAANVDTVFLVSGLDSEFKPRRIERYLVLAWDSGANPVVVLNKADVCPDVESCRAEAEGSAPGVPVYVVSAKECRGLEQLRPYLSKGMTAAMLGSSGVGKSTLINALLGEERQEVRSVRRGDGKGRHTTSGRELILLTTGGVVIDNPGMREVQIWADEEGLDEAFADIEELAGHCRFDDCQHLSEPGCAVKQAMADGRLDGMRFKSYTKLKKELAHLEFRQHVKAVLAEKARWKKISKASKERGKNRRFIS